MKPTKPYRIEQGRTSPFARSRGAIQVSEPSDNEPAALLRELADLRRLFAEQAENHAPIVRTDAQERQNLLELLDIWQSCEGIERISAELEAVISETERAASHVLEAAERIEAGTGRLRRSRDKLEDAGLSAELEALDGQVGGLYETSNFHDITGQRITKVLRVLDAFGERLETIRSPSSRSYRPGLTHEEMLLNGPRLQGDAGHVTQGDIDRIFD